MGTLANIYDALTTLVATALPGYNQLQNAYDVSSGLALLKTQAFAITVRQGRGIELQRGTKRGRERAFGVTLINQIVHLNYDLAGAQQSDKDLIEAMLSVETAIEGDNSLGGLVAKVDYVDDTGVTFENSAASAKYAIVTVNFLVVYEETLP